MSSALEVDRFVKDPSLLVDLCHQVIARIDTRDADKTAEMETQLREISRTVEKLERLGVTVPDALRAEKTRLAAALSINAGAEQALNQLADEIEKMLTDLRARLARGSDALLGGKDPNKRSRSPKTDGKTLRKHIILALRKLGGKAAVADILEEMERQLKGSLLPGDLAVFSSDGKTITWRNKAQWERHRMVREGILRNDSPHGTWELKVEHQ